MSLASAELLDFKHFYRGLAKVTSGWRAAFSSWNQPISTRNTGSPFRGLEAARAHRCHGLEIGGRRPLRMNAWRLP